MAPRISKPDTSLAVRLWNNVDMHMGNPHKCWEWQRGKDYDGYGNLSIPRRLHHKYGERIKTHRLAYMLAKGPIPEGMHVLHSCDNPPCCNPLHLSAGTPKENVADMRRKGRGRKPGTHCLRGHLFDEKNTYVSPNGVRACRKCHRDAKSRRREAATIYDS